MLVLNYCELSEECHRPSYEDISRNGMLKLAQEAESIYTRDKKMHEVDGDLYFAIEESHVMDITEKGESLSDNQTLCYTGPWGIVIRGRRTPWFIGKRKEIEEESSPYMLKEVVLFIILINY